MNQDKNKDKNKEQAQQGGNKNKSRAMEMPDNGLAGRKTSTTQHITGSRTDKKRGN